MKKLLRYGPRTRLRFLHCKHSCGGSSWRFSHWRRASTRRWVQIIHSMCRGVKYITHYPHDFLISLFTGKRGRRAHQTLWWTHHQSPEGLSSAVNTEYFNDFFFSCSPWMFMSRSFSCVVWCLSFLNVLRNTVKRVNKDNLQVWLLKLMFWGCFLISAWLLTTRGQYLTA